MPLARPKRLGHGRSMVAGAPSRCVMATGKFRASQRIFDTLPGWATWRRTVFGVVEGLVDFAEGIGGDDVEDAEVDGAVISDPAPGIAGDPERVARRDVKPRSGRLDPALVGGILMEFDLRVAATAAPIPRRQDGEARLELLRGRAGGVEQRVPSQHRAIGVRPALQGRVPFAGVPRGCRELVQGGDFRVRLGNRVDLAVRRAAPLCIARH